MAPIREWQERREGSSREDRQWCGSEPAAPRAVDDGGHRFPAAQPDPATAWLDVQLGPLHDLPEHGTTFALSGSRRAILTRPEGVCAYLRLCP
jgi:hypothetical protein